MSNLMNVNTMTSKEVAELTGKNHADVMRDIRDEITKLENGGEITQSKFALSSYINSQNKEQPMYQLSIEGVLQLGARYDAITRSKLITMALQPKQEEPQLKLPQNYKEALKALIEAEEVKEQLLLESQQQQEVIMNQTNKISAQEEAIRILTDNCLKITDRTLAVNLIKSIANGDWRGTFNAFYEVLKTRLSIDVALRQKRAGSKQPKISFISEKEWTKVVPLIVSWYLTNGGTEEYMIKLVTGVK